MDFAMLPPEVNSGRLYSGPGAGPMLAAAAAWDGLVAELHSAAASYGSVISELTAGPWLGPASISMAAAAAPYAAWMHTTAAAAEQAATQARAAAAAYETAFTMTVPPPVIAANRSLLMSLIATNIFGQNTPAIAAAEADYGEMWVQDAVAMYGYAGDSASATALTPFTQPPQNTDPAGTAGQGAAVAQAAATPAATKAQLPLSQLTSAVPAALQGLASPTSSTAGLPQALLGSVPAAASAPGSSLSSLVAAPAASQSPALAMGATGLGANLFGALVVDSAGSFGIDSAGSFGIDAIGVGELGGAENFLFPGLLPSLFPGLFPAASSLPPVSAAMGQAASVGALSVPQSWAAAAPAIRPLAAVSAITSVGAAPAMAEATAGNAFGDMALAGMAGRALAGTVGQGRRQRVGAKTGERAAPPRTALSGPVTGIAAELRELAELRDEGILTDDEFTEQKRRLLSH